MSNAKPILENTLVAMGVEGLIETGVESTVIGMQGGPVTPLTFLGDWVINSFTSGANPQMQKLTQWFDGLLKKIGNFVTNGWNKLTKFVDNFLEDTAGFFDDLGVNYDEVADAVIDNSSAKLNSNSDLNTYVDNLGGQPTKDLDTLMQELGIPRSLTDEEIYTAKQLELQMNANKSQADEVLEEVIEGGTSTIKNTIPNADNAVINPSKLTDYALNPDHPVGGNKAKVFESALGYNQSNADDLMKQIYEKLPSSEAVLGTLDAYGQRYTVDIPITGPNGNTVNVRTGWIIRPGSDVPELTTLYVNN